MAKKSAHPGNQLFDYLNGALNARAGQVIEQHLAACADCASVASLVRALKVESGGLKEEASSAAETSAIETSAIETSAIETSAAETSPLFTFDEHPDVSALASFFYRRGNRAIARHVALCRSCAAEIAQYARAERAAFDYNPAQADRGEVPARAWEMIREWEESSFARPKEPGQAISHKLLAKLSKLLSEQQQQIPVSEDEDAEMVPVIVVDRKGEVRGVEMFKKARDERGASILKHAEQSERFDNKPVHALLDFGEETPVVVSNQIRRDTVSLQQPARPDAEVRRADYFIIED